MKKKLLSFLASVVMAAACLGGGLSELTSRIHLVNEPLTAEAAIIGDEKKYEDYLCYKTYDEDGDGIADIVWITDCYESVVSIEIPSEIDGLPVTSIKQEAFEYCSNLENITIPNSVTSIGAEAFKSCSKLASITIPDSVTNIENDAFYGTALLKNQIGVKYVDTWVIDCDSDVTSVEIKKGTIGIAQRAFYGCSSLTDVTICNGVKNIGREAFSDCSNLENITIGNGVKNIAYKAFSCCSNLESITIPNSVTSIGAEAFKSCSKLASITIPDSVTYIGHEAFIYCSRLESVTIPDSVTEIGAGVFYNCTSLKNVTLSNNITSLGSIYVDSVEGTANNKNLGFFENCSSLTSITIPDSVTSIDGETFYKCINLSSITIGKGVTHIDIASFFECPNLKSINICKDNTSYSSVDGILYTKQQIEYIYIPNMITNVTLPNTLTIIGECAFVNCSNLEKIAIENPECEIYDSKYTISDTATIYGYENSTAHDYAIKYNREFVSLDGEPDYLPGDISGNDKIDLYDAIEICKSIMGMRTFTDAEKKVADYNGDGVVDLYDAIGIAKKLLEK